MRSPIEAPVFGRLELIEVFECFDGPRLFSCKDENGQLNLVVWVDETPTSDAWLCVALSAERYAAIEAGRIDLHEAFADAEDGTVLKFTTFRQPGPEPLVERMQCNAIPHEWLPDPGEFLTPAD